MDFGKLDDISQVNFTLPPTHPFTQKVLTGTPAASPRIYVGPPIWSNREWLGKLYPSNAKEKEFLYHYARQFNTIELNVTHYQIPTDTTLRKWQEAVTREFRFCPKWPQAISHEAELVGATQLTNQFVEAMLSLEHNLGTTFLQLSPAFDPTKLPALEHFLKSLPDGFPIAVEFRHPAWFSDEYQWQRTLEVLRAQGAGTVMTDVAGRRDVLHMALTSPTFTLRFVGNELHPTDYARTHAWIDRLGQWLAQGLQEAYIFIHLHENILSPELTKYWVDTLNEQLGLAVEPPVLRPQAVQGTLF
ncbi:DUF72 domain-containing protein [Rhabdobacter roseus]|uniref:Uncharacterized protein YecE (DUF72 family) n=1 Tax=Rhabdobacter roseus TaxID=1655419 RepID=A0A840TPP2_9BACT|nr:DUF72 domain-containing protein [Rhabdobacter roseus]MBB5282020.1 uncharacterized protein YecE (DUF72 family) [Rhabdobacter roseus]